MTINNGARDQLIQNPENKKIIRHEDFIAGVSKGWRFWIALPMIDIV